MAVKKKIIIIINEHGCFACQAYIESATALSDYGHLSTTLLSATVSSKNSFS